MPKFRDLVKNILYEDVEEEEEIEEPEEQPRKPARAARSASAPKTETPVQPAASVVQETETIVAREPAKTTLFGELSMDSVASPDGSAPARPAAKKSYLETRRTQSREYQAVLSPIFGNMDEEEKDISSVHDAITLNKPNEDFELVRVISPIYGTQIQKTPVKPAAPVEPRVQEEPEEEVETIDLKTFLAKKPGKAS